MTVRILTGDCRLVLRTLADASVHCCVTSPPYYGLRDYGATGQIGLEKTPDQYIAELVAVFREVWRVLRDDGTVWLNLGDSYNAYNGNRGPSESISAFLNDAAPALPRGAGLTVPTRKPKDLLLIPARVALALQAAGWWVRSDIIWSKPNPLPESVTDRPTKAHEYVFLLTKQDRYFYDADAVREDGAEPRVFQTDTRGTGLDALMTGRQSRQANGATGFGTTGTRNARSVWEIPTHPYPGAHFATMPPALAERCIKAGTSERGCCPTCKAPWVRIITKGEPDEDHRRACGADASGGYAGQSTKGHAAAGVQDASAVKARILAGMRVRHSEWRQGCDCPAADPVPCVVLDPFGGAGTTGLVADRQHRSAVLIELNPGHTAQTEQRIRQDGPLFAEIAAE